MKLSWLWRDLHGQVRAKDGDRDTVRFVKPEITTSRFLKKTSALIIGHFLHVWSNQYRSTPNGVPQLSNNQVTIPLNIHSYWPTNRRQAKNSASQFPRFLTVILKAKFVDNGNLLLSKSSGQSDWLQQLYSNRSAILDPCFICVRTRSYIYSTFYLFGVYLCHALS